VFLVAVVAAVIVAVVWWGIRLRERRAAARRERARLEEGLRQALKMEAVGRLAGGIAHDFNNLLTVVIGCSEIIANLDHGNPEIDIAVAEIQAAADRGARLTRQLLAFGRRQMLTPSRVDLNSVVREMANLLQRVLGGEISLVTSLAETPVYVVLDRGQMEQAIINLAVNARESMPDGGRLTMSTCRQAIERPDQPDIAPGDYGVLAVSDTGGGISPEMQRHVFEPFFSTKEVGQGSGLGLSMVYGFVKQSGGHVRLRSQTGAGSTFELAFPFES
jgi:two-component system, cell cycle sensor histidine kinase and response regulator CckA